MSHARRPRAHPRHQAESAAAAAAAFKRIAQARAASTAKCAPAVPESHAPVPKEDTAKDGLAEFMGGAVKKTPALTRLNYDTDAYRQSLMQSVGPGRYKIGTPTQECDECFAQDPRYRLASSGNAKCIDRPLIDVDSELQGITRRASKDPADQFQPNGGNSHKCQLKTMPTCRDAQVISEDTRLSNPPCTLRGEANGFNRWEPLCRNPQANVELPFDAYINNRLIVKDNHRPILPTPLDQTNLLPPNSRDDSMITTMPSCSGTIAPSFPMATFQECRNVYK